MAARAAVNTCGNIMPWVQDDVKIDTIYTFPFGNDRYSQAKCLNKEAGQQHTLPGSADKTPEGGTERMSTGQKQIFSVNQCTENWNDLTLRTKLWGQLTGIAGRNALMYTWAILKSKKWT